MFLKFTEALILRFRIKIYFSCKKTVLVDMCRSCVFSDSTRTLFTNIRTYNFGQKKEKNIQTFNIKIQYLLVIGLKQKIFTNNSMPNSE